MNEKMTLREFESLIKDQAPFLAEMAALVILAKLKNIPDPNSITTQKETIIGWRNRLAGAFATACIVSLSEEDAKDLYACLDEVFDATPKNEQN